MLSIMDFIRKTRIKFVFRPGANPINIFHTLRQLYKLVLKFINMLWSEFYDTRHNYFFLRCTIGNLGTLFYTVVRLKKFYRIGPRT